MANQWFRSWHGAPTDTKWLAISKRAGVPAGVVSAIAWALMDFASQSEQRGSIEGFDIEGYAAFSGFDEQQIGAIIIALIDKGLIENNRLKSWDKRQPQKEDFNAKDRKRKQRAKENVTPCHATSRDVTTDKIRLDKDNKEIYTPEFLKLWGIWKPYDMPVGNKKPAAEKFDKLENKEQIITAAKRYIEDCHAKKCKTQHLTTWLNQGGWESWQQTEIVIDKTTFEPWMLKLGIPDLEIKSWFVGCVLNGETLKAPSKFKADYIRKNYTWHLERLRAYEVTH